MEPKDLQSEIDKQQGETLQNHRKDIKELYEHARVANEEMGAIKIDIEVLKTDISWIKSTIGNVDSRVWWILGTVVIGIFAQILIGVMK